MFAKSNQSQGYKGASDITTTTNNLQHKQNLKFQPAKEIGDKKDVANNTKAAEIGINLEKANENVAKNSQVRGNEKQGCPHCGGGCANCGCANCA